MRKKILYIDLDNTICDFSGSPRLKDWQEKARNPAAMWEANFFEDLLPLPGAMAGVRELLDSGLYDVWVLTQPVANSPRSYGEKAAWVLKYLPELKDKIVMTQNKLLCIGDILIDDDERWEGFSGEFIYFNRSAHPFSVWQAIVTDLIGRGGE